eukprot:356565-Chlamydomonas_euryale.AAC.3
MSSTVVRWASVASSCAQSSALASPEGTSRAQQPAQHARDVDPCVADAVQSRSNVYRNPEP